MTRRNLLRRMAALLLCAFLCLGMTFSMVGTAYAASAEPPASGIVVDIADPSNCTDTTVEVGYCVTDTVGAGFAAVEIKVGLDGTWQDVTASLKQLGNRYIGCITVTDNCPVTVRVIGHGGNTCEKVRYIDYFNNGAQVFPTNLIQTNSAANSASEKRGKTLGTNAAGQATGSNTKTKLAAAPLKASASGTDPEAKPDTTPRLPAALTPDGQGTVVDDVTDQDGKEFFTITTPSENTFYLVIDRQRDNENVYFLNAVTESDLLALAEKDKEPEDNNVSAIPEPEPVCNCTDKCVPGEVNTNCPVCAVSMKDCSGKAPAADPDTGPEPEKPEKVNSSTMILVVIAVLAVGGAGYYLKIWKPKHDLDGAEDFDELTGGDEETVNEDDLEPATRHASQDEPEEPDYPEGYSYEEPEEDE